MRPKNIFYAFLLLAGSAITNENNAQNLVPNPGFEEYLIDPDISPSGINESIGWEILENTTDFFHREYGSQFNIPQNFRGYQEAASGDGYAGIIAYPSPICEFLIARLVTPLEKEQVYQVSFKANLSNQCQSATDDLGAAFFYEMPQERTVRDSIFHIKNPEGRILSDTVDWTTLSGYYLAKGGEQFLLLGNFYKPWETNAITNQKDGDPWAYYYIDDVVVEACDTQWVESQAIFDTIICEGRPLQLDGRKDAKGYLWESFGAEASIIVEGAGDYVLNNYYDYCTVIRQTFPVDADDCNCSMTLPAIYNHTEGLVVQPSLNVQSYRIWVYDALGRLVLATSSQEIDTARLPWVSNAYFWQAELFCTSENDIPISRRMSGKMIVAR